jgi:phage terminase small subunit
LATSQRRTVGAARIARKRDLGHDPIDLASEASSLDLRAGNLTKNAHNGPKTAKLVIVNAPRGLDSVGRAAWKEAASILAEIAEDIDLNAPALRAYAHAESIAASLRAEWWADPTAVQKGARGATHANVLLREIDRAERRAADLRSDLGLTPVSRRRAGRAVRGGRPRGAASAADRRQPPVRKGKLIPLSPAVERALARADAES